MKQSIGEMGVDARLLLARLQKMAVGDQVTYEELTDLIGRDVQRDAYSALMTARKAAERDGIVVDVLPKMGIVRLDDVGIVKSSTSYVEKIHRVARRGVRRVSKADYNALPRDLQNTHNLNMSVLGVLAVASSVKTTKKLEGAVAKRGTCLPTAKMLDELKGI
jgi:hypothetical protein